MCVTKTCDALTLHKQSHKKHRKLNSHTCAISFPNPHDQFGSLIISLTQRSAVNQSTLLR